MQDCLSETVWSTLCLCLSLDPGCCFLWESSLSSFLGISCCLWCSSGASQISCTFAASAATENSSFCWWMCREHRGSSWTSIHDNLDEPGAGFSNYPYRCLLGWVQTRLGQDANVCLFLFQNVVLVSALSWYVRGWRCSLRPACCNPTPPKNQSACEGLHLILQNYTCHLQNWI